MKNQKLSKKKKINNCPKCDSSLVGIEISTLNDYCEDIRIECEECGHKSQSIQVYPSMSKKMKDSLFNEVIDSWNLFSK
jgi:transcription elongation factor Elf1